MQALHDAVIVGHLTLAALQDIEVIDDIDTEEAEERPREFLAQTGACPLVARARALLTRLMPPPPPIWLGLLLVGWTVYCGMMRAAVFLFHTVVLGPERSRVAFEEIIRRSA